MRDRIDQKVHTALLVFLATIVASLFLLGLAIERLGSGDLSWGMSLGVAGGLGFAWAVVQRYGSNGRYNPSRIHKHEKAH